MATKSTIGTHLASLTEDVLHMQMIPVESSAIARVGYNATRRILRLEYTNGRIYDYSSVPHAVYDELLVAESAGEFVNLEIKPFYSYSEVD